MIHKSWYSVGNLQIGVIKKIIGPKNDYWYSLNFLSNYYTSDLSSFHEIQDDYFRKRLDRKHFIATYHCTSVSRFSKYKNLFVIFRELPMHFWRKETLKLKKICLVCRVPAAHPRYETYSIFLTFILLTGPVRL